MPISLQSTFEDARRNQLRDGIALSTGAKVAFFEEMVELIVRFGARDRLLTEERNRRDGYDELRRLTQIHKEQGE